MVEDFISWIIGGDSQETYLIAKQIEAFPHLEVRYKQGKLLIWGRVENNALPELLSRSTIVVMPSYREQFGMVALEAMLCGCPVIGSNVGGLKDLILKGETGYLFERGNSKALCAILSGILRNKVDRSLMRVKAYNWAKHFSQEKTLSSILDIYNQNFQNIPDFWRCKRHRLDLVTLKKNVQILLNRKIDRINLLRHKGKHISVECTIGTSKYFLKKISAQQSSSNFIFKIDDIAFPALKSKEEQFRREVYQLENPIAPLIIYYNEEQSIIISQHCSSINDNFINNNLISKLISKIRMYRPFSATDEIIHNYYNVLKQFKEEPTYKNLCDFDLIASAINSKITSELKTFNRIHPQIELYRIKFMITCNAWIMPENTKNIFLKSINFLLNNVSYDMTLPVMSHGDLKKEHFLKYNSNIVICDWEHAKYSVGPVDEAKLTFNIYYKDPDIKKPIRFLLNIIPNVEIFKQAIVWFINQIIIYSIYESTQGDYQSIRKWGDYLDKFIILLNRLRKYKTI